MTLHARPPRAPRPLRVAGLAQVAALAMLGASAAHGADAEAPGALGRRGERENQGHAPLQRRCAPGDAEGLAFLESRLEDNAPYARWWWRAWTGVYVGGMAYEGIRAGFEDDRGERANAITSAVKSSIGLGRALLSQPRAMRGVEDREELPLAGPVLCRQRIALAEHDLHEAAEQAEKERWSWLPHLFNLGLNAAGAAVVAVGYDEDSAWWSGALGFAVGEIRIWSYPWQAGDDWEEYQERFGTDPAPDAPEVTWHLEAGANGARLVVRF